MAEHRFSKQTAPQIRLVAGHGVEGDAHGGATVQHRSRVAKDPTQPNLRQVHLLHEELLAEASAAGHPVLPGQLGENITTRGIDLLGLSTGTRLQLGDSAIVEITGLRNPCHQIEDFRAGLLGILLLKDAEGRWVRKAGVMGVVLRSGVVAAGSPIAVLGAPEVHAPLLPV
jgi:MOSC domain-containing protein YiiM